MRALHWWMASALTLGMSVQAAEVADYRFQGNYVSSIGTAPVLSALPGTQSFVTDTVAGTSTTVLSFSAGAGLVLTPTTGLIASDTYSIAMLVRIDDIAGYAKYLDFENGTDDDGLYNYEGELYLYPDFEGVAAPITSAAYHWIVLTRDVAGNIVGYVDGVQQIAGVDSSGVGVIDAANSLRFFADDQTTTGEESAGAVSRIRIFNHVLSPTDVAGLGVVPANVAIPLGSRGGWVLLVALMFLGSMLVLTRRNG